jgi:hypothetical protein
MTYPNFSAVLANDIRSAPVPPVTEAPFAFVAEAATYYKWDPTSTGTDDTTGTSAYLRPYTVASNVAGRWIAQVSGEAAETIAALAANTNPVGFNGQRLTNVAPPTASTEATTRGFEDARSAKGSVVVVATSNIAALSGEQTIDGVLTSNSRIILVGQTTQSQNGLWITGSGAWTRPNDFAAGFHASGAYGFVQRGTVNAGDSFVCTSPTGSDVVGTDALLFRLSGGTAVALLSSYDVDPQNSSGLASDDNTGAVGHPLRTLARLAQLLGGNEPFLGQGVTVSVNMLSDTNAADPFAIAPRSGILVVVGTSTQQITGTLTSFTARSQASATRTQAATASFGSWTPYVNYLLHTTGGTPTWSWIELDLTAGAVQLSQTSGTALSASAANAPAIAAPGGTDTFEILKPSTVHVALAGSLNPPSTVIFQRCNLMSPAGATGLVDFQNDVCFQECSFGSYCVGSSILENDTGNNIQGGRPVFLNCNLVKGGDLGDPIIESGVVYTPFVMRGRQLNAFYDGGVTFEGSGNPAAFTGGGRQSFGDVGLFATTIAFGGAGSARQMDGIVSVGTAIGGYASPKLWGTAGMAIKTGTKVLIKNNAVTDILLTGALSIAGVTASYNTWDAATATWTHVAAALNQAAIDAAPGGSIIDPLHMCGFIKEV